MAENIIIDAEVEETQKKENKSKNVSSASGVPQKVNASPVVASPSEIEKRKKNLLQQYHDGHKSLKEKLEQSQHKTIEERVMALVDEVVNETDNLLANELYMSEQGNLGDASVVSFKRAEVLEKAIKAIQTRKLYEKDNKVDVDSPSMRVIFKFFMSKVRKAFKELKYDDDASDTFFDFLGKAFTDWQKELQDELDAELSKV